MKMAGLFTLKVNFNLSKWYKTQLDCLLHKLNLQNKHHIANWLTKMKTSWIFRV